jgi:hypothetical protein
LDDLLTQKGDSNLTWLGWLRQSPLKPNPRHILAHIQWLRMWRTLNLPSGIDLRVHQNRLLKTAREGGEMAYGELMKFERERRYATLVALSVEGMGTITDKVIGLHDRIVGKLFNNEKHKLREQFQNRRQGDHRKTPSLRANRPGALLEAKQSGDDPFAAIESVVSSEDFAAIVTDAQKLAQPEYFVLLHGIGEGYQRCDGTRPSC